MNGYPQLAADTLLNSELHGRLRNVVGDAVRRLNLSFLQEPACRERCYEALGEVAFNLIGFERQRAGFSEREAEEALENIVQALKRWESLEREEGDAKAAKGVVEKLLRDMRSVLMGESMIAKVADEIGRGVDEGNLMESFILSAQKLITGNVYYRIVTSGLSKLGNDSATGLRNVRRLGAVQVSSNPVIAARAFDEVPALWERFKEIAKLHPEWKEDPESFADEIAMYGTVISLLPNLLDFRPIALLSDFRNGLVSLQLNPHKAASLDESLNDALKIYAILQSILEEYDVHLMPETEIEGRGRPNVVFKVAGASPAAVAITEALNRIGAGTNDTVTYTVAQEIRLTFATMKGLAEAQKTGIPITQVYITNMEGRLEDHLREAEAERLVRDALGGRNDKDAFLRELAEKLGALEKVQNAGSLDESLSVICSKRYLRSLTDARFIEAISPKDVKAIAQLEQDIRAAGILVTRRVFQLAFRPENRPRWIMYLQAEYGLSEEKAMEVVDKVDLLPSSKRRAEDTFLVLGAREITNLTNTEFPDQQLRVWTESRREGFEPASFENTIGAEPDDATLERLLRIDDFRKAYELTPELSRNLNEVGIQAPFEEGGLTPEQWSSYGPAAKTMQEFRNAYDNFRQRLVSSLMAA